MSVLRALALPRRTEGDLRDAGAGSIPTLAQGSSLAALCQVQAAGLTADQVRVWRVAQGAGAAQEWDAARAWDHGILVS